MLGQTRKAQQHQIKCRDEERPPQRHTGQKKRVRSLQAFGNVSEPDDVRKCRRAHPHDRVIQSVERMSARQTPVQVAIHMRGVDATAFRAAGVMEHAHCGTLCHSEPTRAKAMRRCERFSAYTLLRTPMRDLSKESPEVDNHITRGGPEEPGEASVKSPLSRARSITSGHLQ